MLKTSNEFKTDSSRLKKKRKYVFTINKLSLTLHDVENVLKQFLRSLHVFWCRRL